MIFYLHTPDHGSIMVGSDHVPRIGEKLRLTEHPEIPESSSNWMVGIYRVEDVLYEAPNNPGRQRIDVYGRKIAELPDDLSYSSVKITKELGTGPYRSRSA